MEKLELTTVVAAGTACAVSFAIGYCTAQSHWAATSSLDARSRAAGKEFADQKAQAPKVISTRKTGAVVVAGLHHDDRAAWERLFRGYMKFYRRKENQAFYDTAWVDFLSERKRVYGLGAKVRGELVGIAHFLDHPHTSRPNVCYLQDLFTDQDARGQGVGRALIQAVADWARLRGCCTLYWRTEENNDTAMLLYDKLAKRVPYYTYKMDLSSS